MAKTTQLVIRLSDLVLTENNDINISIYLEEGFNEYALTAEYSSLIGFPLEINNYGGVTSISIKDSNIEPWITNLEIDYKAYLYGSILYEFDLDSPPPKLYMIAESERGTNTFTIEVGAYVDGVYGVLGGPVSTIGMPTGDYDIDLLPIQMDSAPPADVVTIEIGKNDTGFDTLGSVAFYTEKPLIKNFPTASYGSLFPLTEQWIGSVNGFSATYMDLPYWYSVNVDFVPIVGGVSQPINPLSPPPKIYVETEGNDYFSAVRISAKIDGKYGLLGESSLGLSQITGITEIELSPIQYSLDTVKNPTVIRIYDRSSGYRSIGNYGVFVEPSQDYETPSTIYTSFNPMTLSNSQIGPDYSYVSMFKADLGVNDPTDIAVEIGFVPIVNGVLKPIDMQNIPLEVYVYTSDNYAGGVVEIGHYDNGVYKLLGSTTIDGYNNYNARRIVELENPDSPRPKVYLRITGYTEISDGGGVGSFAIYEQASTDASTTAIYEIDLETEFFTASIPPDETEQVSMFYIHSSEHLQEGLPIEIRYFIVEDEKKKYLDVFNPPPYLDSLIGGYDGGGLLQIVTYIDGVMFVLGQMNLPTSFDPVVERIYLTAVDGGGGEPKYFWTDLVGASEYI